MNILVVDDSPVMRRMVRASLRELAGLTFAEAGSGLEAIEQLALGQVGLIISDLNMPDMHGLELLQFLRKHEAYQGIPVLVLTTRGDEASRAALMAAGASRYLSKPFRPDVLAGQVRELIRP